MKNQMFQPHTPSLFALSTKKKQRIEELQAILADLFGTCMPAVGKKKVSFQIKIVTSIEYFGPSLRS